ncbi:MAG: glucose 1-dehydrogenase [Rhodocyclaceae bacterium]|nr:glucose 1-dehydrogenase [Rhodocyclaceae bacterium]
MTTTALSSQRLKGKVALITGAARGIGLAAATRFVREGASVFMTDINGAEVEAAAAALAREGYPAAAATHDASSEAAWNDVAKAALARFGRVDFVINNAGAYTLGSAADATLANWQKTMAVNVDSVFLGTRKGIELMRGHGGAIVNLSSIMGMVADPAFAAYCASKGAVRNFTKSAALQCAEQGLNIRVNSLHPGFVATPLMDNLMTDLAGDAKDAARQQLVQVNIPMRRMAQPEEMASAIFFLCSDDASYMTGAELVVDGGYTAR